jgi:molybdopterin converting factor small subunit
LDGSPKSWKTSETVTGNLERALTVIKKEMVSRVLEALPQGGVMMMIGNKSVNALIGDNYRLQNGDEISIIPIVAGG